MTFQNDVTVIGTGRVGLPLALSLLKCGLKVNGVDSNKEIIDAVRQRKMPFKEPGYQKILNDYEIEIDSDYSMVADSEYLVITVGTPLRQHVEVDLNHIRVVIDQIAPYVKKGHNIVLRSTVAPKVTEYIRRYLEKQTGYKTGHGIYLTYCPERIAEGKALEELSSLPQIIGCADDESGKRSEKLFRNLTQEIFLTDYISAELTKLFSNISRYVYFAVSNHFMMLADEFDANIYEILKMTNHNYPRQIISNPGLTAGTCLRKDFGMINEHVPYMDLLLSSWKVNEFVPKFLVSHILKRTQIHEKKVAVLGYSFKKDSDDARDSLSRKLIRYIQREVPGDIRVCEPNMEPGIELEDGIPNRSIKEAVAGADIVFIAVNHSQFKDNLSDVHASCGGEAWIADVWNLGDMGKIFYQNMEVPK